MTIKIIINADDLGLSEKVNNSTFELIENRKVTAATLLASSPWIEDAGQRARHYPECSFGVHLNVSEFSPLSNAHGLEPLLDHSGKFAGQRIRQVPIDSELSRAIYQEFCTQIQKLQSLGICVSHIDSHYHAHTISRMFPVLKRIQKRFQIRKVRITRNIYGSDDLIPRNLILKKYLFNFMLKRYYRTRTTQGFTDFKTFLERGTLEYLKYDTIEIMVHPGSDSYENEYEQLKTPWQDSIKPMVRLISFRDI